MVQKSSSTFNTAATAEKTPAQKLDAAPIGYQDFLHSLDNALTTFDRGPLSADEVLKNLNGAKTPAEKAVWDKAATVLAAYGGNTLDKGRFITFLVNDGSKHFNRMVGQASGMPGGAQIDNALFAELTPAQTLASTVLHNHFKITDTNNDVAGALGMESIHVQVQSMADKADRSITPIMTPAPNPTTAPVQRLKF